MSFVQQQQDNETNLSNANCTHGDWGQHIITSWNKGDEALGCLVIILIGLLTGLIIWLKIHAQKIQLVQGRCAVQPVTHKAGVQIDIEPPHKTPLCLTGLPVKPDSWHWSGDGSILGFALPESIWEHQLYFIKADGTNLQKILKFTSSGLATFWYMSVDAQYIDISSSTPSSGSGGTIYAATTGEPICSYQHRPGREDTQTNCKMLQLRDGRWWSVTTDLILPERDPIVEAARGRAIISPDQQWILVETHQSEASNRFILIDQKRKLNQSIDIPSIAPYQSCGYPDRMEWHADSKQFTIFDSYQFYQFTWAVNEQGEIKLIQAHQSATCRENNDKIGVTLQDDQGLPL